MKPHFLVIGAQKCGTTSLAHFLRDDPQVFLPAEKELHFFSRDWEVLTQTRVARYLENFEKAAPGQFAGEATPDYLPSRFAAEKVSEVVPGARLIVILRDPIERAISAYLHAQRIRIFSKGVTFEEAIERDAREKGSLWTNLVSYGFYFESLKNWLDFFDSSQMHICLLEDVKSQFDIEIGEIYQHLGLLNVGNLNRKFPHVNEARHLAFPQINRFTVRRFEPAHPIRRALDRSSKRVITRPEPLPQTVAFLRDLYEDQILSLEKLLRRDLTLWPSHPKHELRGNHE